jgi:phage terminase Nu1 subunit (DNA packaging protein)
LKELAEALNVTAHTVSNWKKRGCPHLQSGPYDVEAVRQWAESKDKRHENDVTGKTTDEKDADKAMKAETELAECKTKLATYELQHTAGHWISKADMKESQARMAQEIRKALEAIPAAEADNLTHVPTIAAAKEILQRIVDGVLVQLSRQGEK